MKLSLEVSLFVCVIHIVLSQTLKELIKGKQQHLDNLNAKFTFGSMLPVENMTQLDLFATEKGKKIVEAIHKSFRNDGPLSSQLDEVFKNLRGPINFNNSNVVIGEVFLKNVAVKGLDSFKLRDLKLRIKNLRADYDISFPKLQADVDYKAAARILNLITYKPTGHASLQFYNLRLKGTIRAHKVKNGARNYLKAVAGDTDIHVKRTQLTITGLEDKESMTFIRGVMNIPIEYAVDLVKQQYIDHLGLMLIQLINKVLKNHPLADFMTFIQ